MKKLGDVTYITKLAGFEYTNYLSGNFKSDGIPVIQGVNIKNNHLNLDDVKYIDQELSFRLPRSIVNKYSLLFCYVANVGDCWLNKPGFHLHLGSNIAKIDIKVKDLLPEYLYYWFQKNKSYMMSISKGSVQKNLSMTEIRNIPFDFPNPILQQHIVDTIHHLRFSLTFLLLSFLILLILQIILAIQVKFF
ncbi:truncated Restriction endonuclease, type I [Acholeplasma oculi]|uniref:Truncated Restriction endonuclease, type I n=1 Tax=Acholeplasma oculi TaxID=35623 RepID=A0A061AC23_9MOLU|nr:truncated Restriction endonuclease, type I [Acholeplasma oculi]